MSIILITSCALSLVLAFSVFIFFLDQVCVLCISWLFNQQIINNTILCARVCVCSRGYLGGPPPHQGPPMHMAPPDMRGPHDMRGAPMLGEPRGPMMDQRGPPMDSRGT